MIEDKKTFSRKEMYKYLHYISYCQLYEFNPLACKTLKNYQLFLNKETQVHAGDCTRQNYSCARCQIQAIEVDTQQAVNFMWTKTVGHCGKTCLTKCEGSK